VAKRKTVCHYRPVIARRNDIRKFALTAGLAGLLVSAAMFALSWRYLYPSTSPAWPQFLFWPQYIGWVAGILWGGHDAPVGRIAAFAIPINAVIYAAIIFCATRIIVRMRRSA
jgi:hypothetical protein